MKRKFLAALLALVMVFSMIPVSASAAGNVIVTGDNPITDNDRSVSFHLYTTQLYKLIMLEDNSATADSDVSGVSLLLHNGFGVLDETELSLWKIGVTKAETDYFEYSNTNRGHALEPNNIKGLKISYSTGDSQKEITIDASKLLLHCKRGALGLTADYTIMSSNADKSIVAFYDNGGNAQGVNYSLYDAYLIPRNTTMQSHGIWPETPSYIAYHFVNWDLNKAGGSPFLQTSVVDGDKEVFSQKSALGDETIGTEIHVINTQNELKARFVELHNAANDNDSDITVDDINWDTIKVSVADTDGKETNPNYNTGALPNEWREYQGETYYWVQNFDADLPGLEDTSYYNEHIAFDKITSMTVSADVNGQTYTYTIYKGSDKGDFAVSQLAGNTHIIEIHILAKPEKPDSDDLIGTVELPGILANGTVAIDCTTNNNHSTKTYGLKEWTYSVSDVKWSGSSSDGYYYADVTIVDFKPYVMEYGDGHTPAENQGNDTTITVMYDNTAGAWTVPTNEIPVTYNVVCTTEPGGGDEGALNVPTDDELKAALSGMIQVDCITNEEQHLVESYGVIDGGINRPDPDEVTKNGETYTYTVTVDSAKYLGKYSSKYGNHELVSTGTITITLQYDAKKETWYVDTPVTINVKCDSGTTDPEKPDGDTIIGLLGNEAVLVQCDVADSGHARRYYPLLSGTFTIGDVENNTVKVTVDSNEYLKEYTLYSGKEHSKVIAQDENYFTLTWNGKDWTVSGNPVTFTVHCSTTEEPEEPTAPDVENILGPNAVEVLCVTNNGIHGSKTYGLLNGGYMEQGPDWITGQGEEDGYWQYVVTIDAGVYQAQFNTDTKSKHNLASPAETYLPITLIYRDNTWVIEGTEPYATIELVCDSEEPTLPEKPDDETIYDIFNGNKPVVLACVTENSGHEEQAFDLIPGSYEIGEVKEIGGRYLCDITIVDEQDYIDIYNTETGKEHTLSSANQPIQVLTLKYTDGEWAIDDDGMVFYKVACEDTSTEPTPEPTPDPTPTPGPGGGDKPPYIPPVDPDDSGVSDLLNTDDHIQYLFGYPEGTFGPENNMTRAEVAQMFYNLLLDQDVTITKTFDDVPANAWYAKAVNTLASLGVVSGVGNGDFEPERSITRAEFTSIAMKFAEGKTGGTNIFSDVKSTDWFYRAVVNSTQYGWIHGYGDGTFRPNNPITRVEVTAIVNNMLGREADVDFVTEHYDELNHFSDLAVSHWGYYHIVEATNDHDYTKPSSGENWTELN